MDAEVRASANALITTITLDEACPRCGALQRRALPRHEATGGFFCDACHGALLYLDTPGQRVGALLRMAAGAVGSVVIGSALACVGAALGSAGSLPGVVVAAVMIIVMLFVLGAFLRAAHSTWIVLAGRRLVPAAPVMEGYAAQPIYDGPVFRRRLHDASLEGALSPVEASETRGALSEPTPERYEESG